MSVPDVISVENVSKSYGKIVALRDISLDVAPGSVVELVGSNGAGKTTMIRLLVGALRPDSGSVRVLGMDPFGERRKVGAEVGYMPQAPVPYQDLTVRENIAFSARGHLGAVITLPLFGLIVLGVVTLTLREYS